MIDSVTELPNSSHHLFTLHPILLHYNKLPLFADAILMRFNNWLWATARVDFVATTQFSRYAKAKSNYEVQDVVGDFNFLALL